MENPLSDQPETPVLAPPEIDEVKRSSIRTLHSDVASSVRDNNISITKIALAQQEKNAALPFVAEEKNHFWSAWSIGTILLVLAGIIVLMGAVYVVMSKNVSLPFTTNEPPAPTLVPVVGRITADVSRMPRAELLRTIELFVDSNYSSPIALEALILQEMTPATTTEGEIVSSLAPITLERFFERLGTRAPGRLLRAIGPDMTIGRAGGTPFIVTLSNSYETAFAGLLEWEPFMAEDLPFIAKKETSDETRGTMETPGGATTTTTSSSSVDQTSTTSTSAGSSTLFSFLVPRSSPVWKDIIVKNKDVRALVAHDGEVLLLYAFPKDGLLIIAQTREAFMLVVDALNAPVFGM